MTRTGDDDADDQTPGGRVDYQNPASTPQPVPYQDYVEIEIGRRRKWIGWTLYVLAFAGLATLLVWLFVMLNTTFALAIAVVLFMVGYMVIMGVIASRTHDQSKNQF